MALPLQLITDPIARTPSTSRLHEGQTEEGQIMTPLPLNVASLGEQANPVSHQALEVGGDEGAPPATSPLPLLMKGLSPAPLPLTW
jgi:hypothetical protein